MIFTAKGDGALTPGLIKEAIEWNEELKADYSDREDYYDGDHDINNRQKPDTKSNNKIVTNHAKLIVDTAVGYLLGFPVDYSYEDKPEEIQDIKDAYNKQMIEVLDYELGEHTAIFGRSYELVYAVKDKLCRSAKIDPRNAVCIYDDTVEHNKLYGIVYKKATGTSVKGKNKFDYLRIASATKYYECLDINNEIGEVLEGEVHRFGIVPLIEYRNNSRYANDFDCVKSIIDAYNTTTSDRVNDKEQLVEAILAGYNITLTKDMKKDLIENKMLFDIPPDAKLEYIIKNLDEGNVEILRKALIEDIHKIAMIPDMSDEHFAGNTSGVAIKFKLIGFNQVISKKEKYFKKGLQERFVIYNNYLSTVAKAKKIPIEDVNINFTRNLPQNDLEVAQMANLLTTMASKKTLLEQLSFIEDAEKEFKRFQEEEGETESKKSGGFGGEVFKGIKEDLEKKISDEDLKKREDEE